MARNVSDSCNIKPLHLHNNLIPAINFLNILQHLVMEVMGKQFEGRRGLTVAMDKSRESNP